MRPALWCVAVVCLLMPATASAQSAASRCWRGVHDGIAQQDADLVVQIVCAEVARQAPQSPDRYRVDVYRTGDQGVLAVTQVGAITTRRQVTIPNLEATRTAAPELVASLVGPEIRDGLGEKPGGKASESHWYGWQILLTDGAAVALVSTGSDTPTVLGVASYGLGGPIVHLGHGNPGRAAISLGMRLGLPVLGALAGDSSGNGKEAAAAEVVGAVLGYLTAVIVDSTALAYDSAPEKPAPQAAFVQWSVAPTFGRNSGGLSLGGVF